ncbi:NAD(P)/FAD-dependent oxidoreductase [Flavisphingomonas formosensis]|uniref:NAD(P)/FAD-dependent oxidoreductase n=1 Tax=Flavisphingomonas formosensis TaxID=861534 RepID=UPI0012F9E641|nr:FAD-dependent oxidoreductase [Sphingomonas formosensis]
MSDRMIVIGGGLVGAAVAFGAAREGLGVCVLDQGDSAFRASRGNFGLVWVSSKGAEMPRYAAWSRDALKLWPDLQRELQELTGVDSGLRQVGGFWLGFSDKEMKARYELLSGISRAVDGIPFRMMEPSELRHYLPGLGPKVAGGSFCELDGDANPLMLLRALHSGLIEKGADIVSNVDVVQVRYDQSNGVFEAVAADGQRWQAERLVLAAGLGNARLAPQVGLQAPVKPSRGQVLITERLQPFLHYPMNKLRQTVEGSVQIGSSSEDVGFDDGTTPDVIEWQVKRAVAAFPALAKARLVRAWGALRPLAPDAYPIYEESESCPGAFVVTSHSGVTLAAAHCYVIGPWAAGLSQTPPDFADFSAERFRDPNKSFSHAH